MIPEQIGSYRIDRKLGAGGMGNVYLAYHRETGERVALKELPPSLARDEGFVLRFNREIEAVRSLNHPSIVRFFEGGQDGETYFYAMEYVEGETLMHRLHRERKLPWREAVDIAIQICAALKAAHDAGIVHRDLKPSNLMLTADRQVKLTDFGVAQVFAGGKLTLTGAVIGTAEYMSPEQTQGRRVTRRSDLYSLGAVLYVMLTGRPPFTGPTVADVLQKQRFSPFDRPKNYTPEIPPALDELVCQLLDKDPTKRLPDAYVLSKRLQEIERLEDYRIRQRGMGSTVSGNGVTPIDRTGEGPPVESGATLMRDLIKAELVREQGPVAKFFNNTFVLVTLLALVVVGTYWLLRRKPDTPQTRFETARAILLEEPSRKWLRARDEYLIPLVEEDPEKWRPVVDPYLQQIEIYELEDKVAPFKRRKSGATAPTSEPERLLRVAQSAVEAGDLPGAERQLRNLQTLLADDQQYVVLKIIVDRQLAAVRKEQIALDERRLFARTAVERGVGLWESGERAAAAEVWRSVVDLYADDPTLGDEVRQATAQLERYWRSPADAERYENRR